MLPPHLYDQIRYCTLVAPLFCYNYVEHHLPHLVARQFQVLDGIDLNNVGSDLTQINFKANAGRHMINFQDHYKKEMGQWESRRLAQRYWVAEASTSQPADSPRQATTSEESEGLETPLVHRRDISALPPSQLAASPPSFTHHSGGVRYFSITTFPAGSLSPNIYSPFRGV